LWRRHQARWKDWPTHRAEKVNLSRTLKTMANYGLVRLDRGRADASLQQLSTTASSWICHWCRKTVRLNHKKTGLFKWE